MFTSPPPRSRPLESIDSGPSPLGNPPKRSQPYLATAFAIVVFAALPAVAVQWYAVANDSGMYARISTAMLLVACFLGSVGTPYRDDETAERAAAEAGGKPSPWKGLRLVPWGRCAVAYLSAVAPAVLAVVAAAYDRDVAFPALSLYWTAVLAVSFIAPLKRWVRGLPSAWRTVATSVPMGLFIGGMSAQYRWFEDPWVWISIALSVLVPLRTFGSRASAWIRERRQRRADRVK